MGCLLFYCEICVYFYDCGSLFFGVLGIWWESVPGFLPICTFCKFCYNSQCLFLDDLHAVMNWSLRWPGMLTVWCFYSNGHILSSLFLFCTITVMACVVFFLSTFLYHIVLSFFSSFRTNISEDLSKHFRMVLRKLKHLLAWPLHYLKKFQRYPWLR